MSKVTKARLWNSQKNIVDIRDTREIKKLLLENNGEFFLDIIIGIMIMMSIVMSFLTLPEVFIKKQEIDYFAKTVARRVEIEGELNHNVTETINNLAFESGFTPTIEWAGNFYGASNKLQIREKFKLTLRHKVKIKLIDPAFSNPVYLEVPISKTVYGVSEVYWK